jgi:hypothetical protein
MAVRILDLDGSLTQQRALLRLNPALVWAQDWGPSLRLACSAGLYRRFEHDLARRLGSASDLEPTLTLYGSGDFHHVSLAMLRRLTGSFNLLILDKHPDWMRWIPFLHCGTWLAHAFNLRGLRRVFHLGGELDFDNGFRWLAPWADLYSGRITVFPAVRRFRGRRWRDVPHQPLRSQPDVPITADRVEHLLSAHREELAQWPLYISLDKDVMTVDHAVVNWDSGHLSLAEVEAALEVALDLAGHRLAGMDIVGDWSPVEVRGWLRRWLDFTEHPRLVIDPAAARERNQETNLALLASHAAVRLGQSAWVPLVSHSAD